MSADRVGRDLASLQSWLLEVITQPADASCEDHERFANGSTNQLQQLIRGDIRASAATRLEVYRSGYFSRIEECLADDFPTLKYFLGADAFSLLCRDYITARPSTSPSLNYLGRGVPAFLKEWKGTEQGAFASDLARLEWMIVEAIHAPAGAKFEASELARIPGERLSEVCFIPNPSLRLLSSEYPVNAFLQERRNGGEPEAPTKSRSCTAVVRHLYRIRRFDIEPEAGEVLAPLVDGLSLGAALSGVSVTQTQLETWFRDWTERGLFSGLKLPISLDVAAAAHEVRLRTGGNSTRYDDPRQDEPTR